MKCISSILFVLLLTSSCSKECPEIIHIGEFQLSDKSKNQFPYKLGETKIIFKDEDGNELIGVAERNFLHREAISGSGIPCLENPDFNISIEANTEYSRASVNLFDLNLWFDIYFRVEPRFSEDRIGYEIDIANITLNVNLDASLTTQKPGAQLEINLDLRNEPGGLFTTRSQPRIALNNKEFNEVFSNSSGEEFFKFYYNHEFGILGFEDMSTGKSYTFDRYE